MTSEVPPAAFAPEPERRIGVSFRPSYARRVASGFMQSYFAKPAILDIGFRGEDPEAVPITPGAVGVDLDYPGYDGVVLPFADESQDTVLAAHVLEHIEDYRTALRDWLRVLKIGGFLVLILPHRDLYERKPDLPSRWNGDHKRFYTPASLLAEVEASLPVNAYRVRHLFDNDVGFDYARPPEAPPFGGFEIELVLEKIARPAWSERLRYPEATRAAVERFEADLCAAVEAALAHGEAPRLEASSWPGHLPPWMRLRRRFPDAGEAKLRAAMALLLQRFSVDEAAYVAAYEDLRRAHDEGRLPDPAAHWREHGYFEGRTAPGLRQDGTIGRTDS